jgi:hypothetical protein
MTTPEPRKPQADRHTAGPIPFRPPAAEREWLTAYAVQTGRPVNALLTEALRLLREHAEQEGMP